MGPCDCETWNIDELKIQENNSSVSRFPSNNVPEVEQMAITQTHTVQISLSKRPDNSTGFKKRDDSRGTSTRCQAMMRTDCEAREIDCVRAVTSYTIHMYITYTQNTHDGLTLLTSTEYLLARNGRSSTPHGRAYYISPGIEKRRSRSW